MRDIGTNDRATQIGYSDTLGPEVGLSNRHRNLAFGLGRMRRAPVDRLEQVGQARSLI